MKYLMDSDALIDFQKENQSVVKRFNAYPQSQIVTSAICAFEFDNGFYLYKGKSSPFKIMFPKMKVLPLTKAIAAEASRIVNRKNIQISEIQRLKFDALIAATADHYGLKVITKNSSDFSKMYSGIAVNWTA